MTLEELPATLSAKGLLLNNLFQLDSGQWRCNVRHKSNSLMFSFGTEATPSEAVARAIANATGQGSPPRRNTPRASATPVMSGADLLSTLGLS